MLISVPRDSYLSIPGHGKNKVNAAFAIGGPKLLAQTLEQATGLPIDGYVEIGFGGFAGVVDSLGGVEVCVKRDIKDAKAAHRPARRAARPSTARTPWATCGRATPTPRATSAGPSGSASSSAPS